VYSNENTLRLMLSGAQNLKNFATISEFWILSQLVALLDQNLRQHVLCNEAKFATRFSYIIIAFERARYKKIHPQNYIKFSYCLVVVGCRIEVNYGDKFMTYDQFCKISYNSINCFYY